MVSEILNVKVDKITRFENGGKVKAFCDLLFGNFFLIRGFRVVEGEKGIFVGMPRQQGRQGGWFDVFLPATTEVKEYLTEVILQAYQEEQK